MAPNRGRNRAAEFEELVQPGAKDFDPEEDDFANPASDDDNEQSDASDDGHDGREHYAPVAKSKLRKPQQVALGPQYQGSKIRRDDLDEDEEEDDPFNRGFDEEDSEEDESVEDGEGDEEDEDSDEEDEDDVTDATSDEEDAAPARKTAKDKDVQNELKQIVAGESRKAIAASLSQANREEAEKGAAVKQQRATFDALLGTRMKLQKTLVATNTIVGISKDHGDEDQEDIAAAVQAAEAAAFNLWNSLNDLRASLSDSQSGKKRKRAAFTIDTPTEDLWTSMQAQEEESKPKRNATLEKWSKRTQGPTVLPDRGRLNQDRQATIVDVLQEQLSNMDRLVTKTHAPRSCAPLQAGQRVAEDPAIYDDADFYGILLKELLEQKSHDSVAASSIDIGVQLRRDNKTKRHVDTKASKGRKLRYTVQEKLQNFMAPEPRATWPERQADELFGSLFGQRMQLGERDEDSAGSDDEIDYAEAGLLMFKS